MTTSSIKPTFVSVIIPSYNRAHLISSTIDSVLAQTYPHLDVIVVDDGSTDDTQAVLARYDSRVRYIYQQNAGPSAARNHGVRVSESEFIAFLDSDDTISPTKLEKQIAFLTARPEVDIVLCGWRDLAADQVTVTEEVTHLPVDAMLKTILETGIFGLFAPNVPLLRRNHFLQLNGFDESLPAREEQDFWIRAALTGSRFGMVEEVLCSFHDTPDSRGKKVANVEKVMPIILERVFSHPNLPPDVAGIKDETYARVYIDFGVHRFLRSEGESSPEMALAKAYFAKAARLSLSKHIWFPNYFSSIADHIIQTSGSGDPDAHLKRVLAVLFPKPFQPAWLEAELQARIHFILAFRAHEAGQGGEVRRHIAKAVLHKPNLIANKGFASIFMKSITGKG